MGDDAIPRVSWAEFCSRFDWKQGEHVALVGPTGQGKTTLALQLLNLRSWVVVIATKPKDATLGGLVRHGFQLIRSWPPPNDQARRVLLWPRWRSPLDTRKQAGVIRSALLSIFREGAWCVFADDVQYLTTQLGLRDVLTMLWLQARSLDISVMAASQRPRWAPREMWTQSTHLFIWGTNDAEDLKALSGLGGMDTKVIRSTVATLAKHDVLYINARDRRMAVTRLERTAA